MTVKILGEGFLVENCLICGETHFFNEDDFQDFVDELDEYLNEESEEDNWDEDDCDCEYCSKCFDEFEDEFEDWEDFGFQFDEFDFDAFDDYDFEIADDIEDTILMLIDEIHNCVEDGNFSEIVGLTQAIYNLHGCIYE